MRRDLHHGHRVEMRMGPMGILTNLKTRCGKSSVPDALPWDDAPGTPEDVLLRALELLGPHGERWVQHTRRDHGRYCAIAAIEEAASGDPFLRREAEERLRATVGRSPMLWNDTHGRPFAEIRAGFASAIAGDRSRM